MKQRVVLHHPISPGGALVNSQGRQTLGIERQVKRVFSLGGATASGRLPLRWGCLTKNAPLPEFQGLNPIPLVK